VDLERGSLSHSYILRQEPIAGERGKGRITFFRRDISLVLLRDKVREGVGRRDTPKQTCTKVLLGAMTYIAVK
jgi:hypothetical protein